MRNVGILGCGRMGARIAKLVVEEFNTTVFDQDTEKLEAIKEDNPSISVTSNISDLSDAELIIECVFEELSVKQAILREIEGVVCEQTVISSNTSSISINELASFMRVKERFIGIHFMNPPEKISLVEVIRSKWTSKEVFEQSVNFIKDISKTPVESQDTPGFILNRILVTMLNEALVLLGSGTATKEDIDLTMVLGAKHPIGPIALVDMIGLDIVKHIMDNLTLAYGDKYKSADILQEYIEKGRLGKKVGHGFYDYIN